jgi:hypothetical protein
MLELFKSILREIESNWINFFSMVATVVTGFVAVVALTSWKQEKRYEIKMNAFAKSRSALDLVKYLRSPISFNGIVSKELEDTYLLNQGKEKLTPVDTQALIFTAKLKYHETTYKEILYLRETLWATYGERNIYYRFYDAIITTILRVHNAHDDNILLQHEEFKKDEEFKIRRNEIRSIICSVSNDPILNDLSLLYDELTDTRLNLKSRILKKIKK